MEVTAWPHGNKHTLKKAVINNVSTCLHLFHFEGNKSEAMKFRTPDPNP